MDTRPILHIMATNDSIRRHLLISVDLYHRVRDAAARETLRTKEAVSVSAWIREAIAQRLEREEERAA